MGGKIAKKLKKVMPPISETEQEALESGTVGFEGELINGKPDFDKLRSLEEPKLSPDEQAFMDHQVEKLCSMLNDWEINQSTDLPEEIWDYMKKEGFFGLVIPKEYGGKGFSAYGHSEIVMKIASRSLTAAVTVMVPNSLGPGELLSHYGTKEQKEELLPRLADGREVPAFGLTGSEAGSDAGNQMDTGVVCKNEDGVLGIRMNWDKRYITLGPVSTLLGIAFTLKDPDNLLKGEGKEGITLALIPTDTPGVDVGRRHLPMDLPFQNGPNSGRDVFVPMSAIIGGQKQAGGGWKMLMEALAIGRSISLPSTSVAGAKLATISTGAYARVRRQFGISIGKFEGVEEVLARMAGTTYMMDGARKATTQMVDRGERPAIPSAIVKYHLTEKMRKTINDAMDVQAGKAAQNGPSNLLANTYKGIPIGITVEGANIMTRSLIIFGQGMIRSHKYLLDETKAIQEENMGKLSRLMAAHMLSGMANGVRSVWMGLTNGGGNVPDRKAPTAKYYKQINRLSAAFNLASNATLGTLGGELKRKERVSARLGDVLSNLYLASTTLRHFESQGSHKEDIPLMKWAAEQALYDAEQALDKLLDNYPNKAMGAILRAAIFPRGKLQKAPSDKLDHQVAKLVMEPGPARDRLADGLYVPTEGGQALFDLEDALRKTVATEPLEKKIAQAIKDQKLPKQRTDFLVDEAEKIGVLSKTEADALREANKARARVVRVDDFDQKLK